FRRPWGALPWPALHRPRVPRKSPVLTRRPLRPTDRRSRMSSRLHRAEIDLLRMLATTFDDESHRVRTAVEQGGGSTPDGARRAGRRSVGRRRDGRRRRQVVAVHAPAARTTDRPHTVGSQWPAGRPDRRRTVEGRETALGTTFKRHPCASSTANGP